MDKRTAHILCAATSRFYRQQAHSFSDTRQAAWPGWERLLLGPAGRVLAAAGPMANSAAGPATEGLGGNLPVRLLDVGCGNLRFERFLAGRLPGTALQVHAVDNCEPLVALADCGTAAAIACRHHALDVVESLLDGTLEQEMAGIPACSLVVCFGFFHHVPGADNRARLLRTLLGKTAPGGVMVVSLWQFLNSAALAAKAEQAHSRGLAYLAQRDGLDASCLEAGDYLLGWQNHEDAFRYCHAFTTREVQELVESAAPLASLSSCFQADGRTGNLNAYLVFTRI